MTIAINNKLMKECKVVFTGLAIFSLVLSSFAFAPLAPKAQAALTAVGPILDPVNNGYPQFYSDENGLALQLCLDQGPAGLCVLTPGFDPLIPPITPIGTVLSGNFPDESFYFIADALLDPGVRLPGANTDIKITYRAALEQAFLGALVPGTQNIFLRVQADVNGLVPNSTYTVAGPYGIFDVPTDATGGGRTRFEDMGACVQGPTGLICDFANPLATNPVLQSATTNIGAFLQWDDTLPAPPAGFIGDPNVLHTVSGGRGGINSVTVTGADVGGLGVGSISTNLFAVAGQLADTIPPVIGATTPALATLSDTNVVISANVTDNMGVAVNGVTVDIGALSNNFSANLTGAQEVPASASTATGSGTFTIDTAANTLSYNISYTGLTGGVETAAHIHGPALAGAEALPLFDLNVAPAGAAGSPKIGVWNYPEASEADILAGRTYVNIHTVLFADGEIRGQILPTPDVRNMTMTVGTNLNGTWSFAIPSLSRAGSFVLPIRAVDGSGNAATANHSLNIVVLTTINVTPAANSILVAGTQQLSAATLDQNNAPIVPAPILTWTSSNPAVATVSPTGLVTGVGAGTATITATSGSVSGTATFIVNTATPVFTTISTTPPSASILIAGTQQLTASAVDQFNNPMVPQPAIAWTSSDPTVATVDASGLVTGIAAGSATITASATIGAIALTGVSNITVSVEPPVFTSVSVAPATVALTSVTQQLTASALDQFGNPIIPQPAFTWTSDNAAVATVDANGLVAAVSAGSATITATSDLLSGTSAVTVNATATSINVTPSPASVVVNAATQLSASALDQFGSPMVPQPAIAWTSSDPTVATVDASGLVTGIAAGSATITATSGLLTGTAVLTVTDVPQVLTSIAINPATVSVVTGAAAQLSASALDQFGSPMVPQPAIAWTSSDPTVATVDASGLVTGIAIGSATITAASGAISGASSITVTLAPPVLTTISVSPAAASVNLGGTYKFTASVLDQFGLPFVATTIWASSNPAVGTVDANGLFTAVSAGETAITATSGSISGSAIATVGAPSSILSVTQVAAIKTFATADDTYANGWKWVFNATVPDNETKLAMKFSDWVSGGNAIAAASNIRIFSTQSSDANSETTAIAMTSAGAYSANMTLNGDMDAGVLGRQIQITIEVKIPAGSASGSYSTSYGIQTLQ